MIDRRLGKDLLLAGKSRFLFADLFFSQPLALPDLSVRSWSLRPSLLAPIPGGVANAAHAHATTGPSPRR